MSHRDLPRQALWITIYLFFILGPLFVLLLGTMPPSRDFATEFSVALGYSGLAMMGLQFGLTARFRHVTQPLGEDVIYHFHRRVSLIAVTLVFVHPLILLATGSKAMQLPDSLLELPLGAVFAGISIGSLLLLVVTARWRTRLKIRYEVWHASHIVLALLAIGAGLFHMIAWGFYLDNPRKRAFWIAMVALWIVLLLYVRLFKPLFMLRRPYRIAEVRRERGETTTLVMRPDGHTGFRFRPGQFGWLTIWGSPFKITGHPFSFSSSAAVGDGLVEMSIRRLGDFTDAVQSVAVGQRVYLDGPYGSFTVRDSSAVNVMVAGGIGITPMMSMIRTLADRGDNRRLILIYGSRDWESITFREELEALREYTQLTVVHVLSRPPEGWIGETGYINAALLKRHLPDGYADHEYFICGPGIMMDAVEAALSELDVPLSRYHSERYSFV